MARKTRKTPRSAAEGQWLVEAMKRAGIKNIQVVERLSLNTDNLVSQWRTGECPISDLQMLQLGNMLNEDVLKVRPELALYYDATAKRSILEGLSPADVEMVLNYIEMVKAKAYQDKFARPQSKASLSFSDK